MYACSHWYFFQKSPERFLNTEYPKVKDPVLARLSIGLVPDLDFIFNKWPSLRSIYKGRNEALHEDEQKIIEVAESKPGLYDLKGISIHNKQDDIIHHLIDKNTDVLKGELSEKLDRNVSKGDIEKVIENYVEGEIIKKFPYVREEMLKALKGAKKYYSGLAEVLYEVYKEYDINQRSFRRATFVGNLFERIRLKSKRYTRYIPKRSGERIRKFSYKHIIICQILDYLDPIEFFDFALSDNGVVKSVLSEGYEEKIPPLGPHTKRMVDKFLT